MSIFAPFVRRTLSMSSQRTLSYSLLLRSKNVRFFSSKNGPTYDRLIQSMAALKNSDDDSTTTSNIDPKNTKLSSLITPVIVKKHLRNDEDNIGEEMVGSIDKEKIQAAVNQFASKDSIKRLISEEGMDDVMSCQALRLFSDMCQESVLPVELHITFYDIISGNGYVEDILPHFLSYARKVFPHLSATDDLEKLSDLREAANWYPEARSIRRKIVMHVGPTNSGKTYHALKAFYKAKTGLYCSPLRLLANEVYKKSNDQDVLCNLVTGEDKRLHEGAEHISCTVEMCSTNKHYEVAIIDEIQMLKDLMRGYAWTRAVLGAHADEVHLCGEETAVDIVKKMVKVTGDSLEVHKYERLSKLVYQDEAVESVANLQAGDCVVCFSKKLIYQLCGEIAQHGKECAIIYGSLPPETKLRQAEKFNDPDHPCKIMVATDAVGMGINLAIRRVVFYGLTKQETNEKGILETTMLNTSQARQIAGRAGRYSSGQDEGYVTTFFQNDLPVLKDIVSKDPENIEKAGIAPTADQIEMFSYHLPNEKLSKLMMIFLHFSNIDEELFFQTNMEEFCQIADLIEHIPLSLRVKYTYCLAPVANFKILSTLVKFARRHSEGLAIDADYVMQELAWHVTEATTIAQLKELENIYACFDIYLWLGSRFSDIYTCLEDVSEMQKELESVIFRSVEKINRLRLDRKSQIKKVRLSKYQAPLPRKPVSTEDSTEQLTNRLENLGVSEEVMQKLKNELRNIQEKDKNTKERGVKHEKPSDFKIQSDENTAKRTVQQEQLSDFKIQSDENTAKRTVQQEQLSDFNKQRATKLKKVITKRNEYKRKK